MEQEEIKNIFNKIDTNGDGYITKEEFQKAVQEHDIASDSAQIEAFMSKVDTDQDGKVSFDEFSYFVQFNKSELSNYNFLLDITSSSIGFAKQVEKIVDVKTVDEENPSLVRIVLRDEGVNDIYDMQSFLQIHVGDFEANEHVSKILKHKLDTNGAIGLKFHVKDKELIKSTFGKYIQDFKNLIGGLGPEVSEVIETFDIQLIDVDEGVMLIVDAASHPLVTSYIELLKSIFEQLQKFKASLSIKAGFGKNIADKSLTFEQLIDSNFYIELSGKSIKLSHLAQYGALKVILQILNADKGNSGFLVGLICALSFKNANVEILLNAEDRKECIKDAQIQGLNDLVWNTPFINTKMDATESDWKDFIKGLDFMRQASIDLKKAECSSISLFAKVHDVYLVLNSKADIYSIIEQLFNLQ